MLLKPFFSNIVPMITFQQLIQKLSHFWEKQGCIIHLGHDVEVGAGTFNPATFLRCLGKEPYRTAYVEPSRRPSDARYGENPNRLQLFHQFQVILKPSPENVQELYLKSLEAVGIDLKKHDIRFVHSDWESPTLGAWGLGWEVWCDGMEISQFTYFQAIGSLPLKPISAEITYGLERLAMYIQNVDSIFDLYWNEKLTFRALAEQMEVEWSHYNLEEATTSMWLRHFDDYEKEAKTLIHKHLSIPAYDFVLKASHAFNMLDARGVISVTERTGYIARVRDLARLVATEYLASREKLGFPLFKESVENKSLPKVKRSPKFNPEKKEDFLLEIGSEEIPDSFIPSSMLQLERALRHLLESNEIPFETIHTYATPRRLSALIIGLAAGSQTKWIERRGPAIAAAFNDKGIATAQGEGFLKSLGLPLLTLDNCKQNKQITVRTIKENDYLFAQVQIKGKSTFTLLANSLPTLILNLDFPKKMRWGDSDISYARPLHWLVALFGNKIVPFQIGNIASNRFSFGHRQHNNKKFSIKKADDYLSTLKTYSVLANVSERRESILGQIAQIEKKLNGKVCEKEKVLPQVLHLTEWPELDYASFDPQFLNIPHEVIASEMVDHQKYFPLKKEDGTLLNYFIITADNHPSELIRTGNQKVLSARLNDGVFLYTQDLKTRLETFNEKLKTVTFQKELGSMMNKVERLTQIAHSLNKELKLADPKKLERAALLCKSDLASALVGEFPDLQGTIGKYYALAQNEEREVAEAIKEHWLPTSEQAPLPSTPTGTILSLADKIDNLISYFRIGLKPTSSSDPYALRRQTLGILKILIEGNHSLNLRAFIEDTSKNSPLTEEILLYITSRAKTLFEEYGFRPDEIEASLQGLCVNPYDQFSKLKAVHQFRKENGAFTKLLEVYKRAKGQLDTKTATPFNENLPLLPAEKELIHSLHLLEKEWNNTLQAKNYIAAFHLIATLQQPLAKLFDTVKILDDNPLLRTNRIALLHKVFHYFNHLLDFSKIQIIP